MTRTAAAAFAAGALTLALTATSEAQAQSAAAPLSAQDAAALRGELTALKARIEDLERRLAVSAPATGDQPAESAPPALAQKDGGSPAGSADKPAASKGVAIDWKGSPQFAEGDRAFKVKGRIQADFNTISAPDGLRDRSLGFSSEFRRIRLGGEGNLGSGFGYKLEVELSDNAVDLVDTYVTYKKGPWLLTLGNQNQFQSLDELIGDTSGSVMERAAFTDAFNFERRLGFSAQYAKGVVLAQAGVFTDDINALANSNDGPFGGDENNSHGFDGRLVIAPKWGETQLHFGGSGHWRELGRLEASTVRYRQRPFIHSSNSRFIGTPELSVSRETSYGVEFAGARGPLHWATEAHWLQSRQIGAPTAHFWGGYGEVGYFLTEGDTRPYSNGVFGAAKPKRPFGKGGPGAIQVNLRYDYLDLNSGAIRGGTQNGYIAALVWTPIQYLRFNLNYAYLDYDGATRLLDGRTDYGMHVIGSRFELDF